ncbi:hypothetical protein B0H14DRAFT_2706153 [Mycena olivaceomarginata]|nr:hypothetical protein B0H14DRAFT_2706153 [Mycena olivaceomarginata]
MHASTSRPQTDSNSPNSSQRHAPTNIIWQWTLKPEAVASCFAQDVFDMQESGTREAEFFWLGRIPCRSVKLVGLLVGVQAYEQRVIYHLDDGTAVIECHHRPPAPNQPKQEKPKEPLPLLEPLAYVGYAVTIIGRVSRLRETRKITIDSIVRCSSSNDEPNHWIAVGALHRTHYYIQEPFVLPLRPVLQTPAPMPTPSRRNTSAVAPVPATPSTASSAPSSPSKSSVRSSPHKLRHPSRLHTADLTDNAFRIYLKHYMDYADDNLTTRGFTQSHLRRVPELALMAKRVVKAEAKRRARSAAKRTKEAVAAAKDGRVGGGGVPGKKPRPVVVTQAMLNDQQKLHPRMKRLFNHAIMQLVRDGDVISWDGPRRPCPPARGAGDGDGELNPNSSALWKLNSSSGTQFSVGGNSTVFSNASVAEDDEDEGELSDPAPDEEAFVSLTPAVLAPTVEHAISKLVAEATARGSRARAAPAAGPTVPEIVSFLKNDDMWRNLSEFTVNEALGLLKDEGRAWTMGGGRWELSI